MIYQFKNIDQVKMTDPKVFIKNIYNNNNILPNLILPYLRYKDSYNAALIDKSFGEFMRNASINNIEESFKTMVYMKKHKNIKGLYLKNNPSKCIILRDLTKLKQLKLVSCWGITTQIFHKDFSKLYELEYLNLDICKLLNEDVIFQKSSSILYRLKYLQLSSSYYSNKIFNKNFSVLSNLMQLNLIINGHQFTDEIFNKSSSCLNNLRHLEINKSHLTIEIFNKDTSVLGNLEYLHILGDFSEEMFLKDFSVLSNLTHLFLDNTQQTSDIFAIQTSILGNLTHLKINRNYNITEKSFMKYFSVLNKLISLDWIDTTLHSQTCSKEYSCLGNLTELKICMLQDKCFSKEESCLGNLEKLSLSSRTLESKYFSKEYSCMKNLTYLDLGYSFRSPELTDEIFSQEYSCLGNLKHLVINNFPKIFIKTFEKEYSCLGNLECLQVKKVTPPIVILFKNFTCLNKLKVLTLDHGFDPEEMKASKKYLLENIYIKNILPFKKYR